MEGRLKAYPLALICSKDHIHLPAITARFTSAVAQIAIGAKFHVTSGDVTSSLKQAIIWITDAKHILAAWVR
jgi:hypothetical protein